MEQYLVAPGMAAYTLFGLAVMWASFVVATLPHLRDILRMGIRS